MALTKPYKRIYREHLRGSCEHDYFRDPLYAADRLSCIHSYHLLEKDLKILFDYISPNSSNGETFSLRIYELFFRACTEFENNATAILKANNYTRSGNWNCTDYFKINQALFLSNFEVQVNVWEDGPLILKPFQHWASGTYASLPWYQDYNLVKHERATNFSRANLKNLMESMAGVLSILYAQFAHDSFSPYQPISMTDVCDGFETANDSLFQVKPHQFVDAEKYDFNWSTLKSSPDPFTNFPF